jgi:hypothetical protein
MGSYDHDANAISPCEICPANTYQNQLGATSCTACPVDSPQSDPGSPECTAQPLYVGCFEDRESLTDGRNLQGARHSMGDDASLEVCAELCAGYAYMGLQWADQCFCGNAYGAYSQLENQNDGKLTHTLGHLC